MRNPFKDITGVRFGRLVALEMHSRENRKTTWLCRCDCGNKKLMPLNSLTSGKGKSCGCLRKEVTSKQFKKHGKMNNERLYTIWSNMRDRCFNQNASSFKNYGGRGITVCKEWDDFTSFYKWSMDNGYSDDLTIDRINVNGNYEPSNCRWANWEVQMNNTTQNVFVEIDGVTRTLAEHAKFYDVNYSGLYYRYSQGLKGKELIGESKRKPILIEINGETKRLKDWARIYKFSYGTLQYRYKNGLRGEELFKPVDKVMSEKANKSNKKWESA